MPKQTFFNLDTAKQEHLIKVAMAEFAENSFEGSSINRIVEHAKIAKGSFYQYFEDKEDLYEYIIYSKLIKPKTEVMEQNKKKLLRLNIVQYIRLMRDELLFIYNKDADLIKIISDFNKEIHKSPQKAIYEKYSHINRNILIDIIIDEQSRNQLDRNIDPEILNALITGFSNYGGDLLSNVTNDNEYVKKYDLLIDKLEYIFINGIYKGTDKEGI